MNWHKRLLWLLGAASPAALFAQHEASAEILPPHVSPNGDVGLIFTDPALRNRLIQLAGHSSHSSHASHSSHYSGSGGGGYNYSPPPIPVPPPAPTPRQTTTNSEGFVATSPAKKMSQDDIAEVIQRTQIALITKGFDPGPVNGRLSAETKTAIKAYQQKQGLAGGGYLTAETLRTLGVIP